MQARIIKKKAGGNSQKQGRNLKFFWCDHHLADPSAYFFSTAGKILSLFIATRKTSAIIQRQRQNFNIFSAPQANF
jgi:hypothetical protein